MLVDQWIETTRAEMVRPDDIWGKEASAFSREERLRQSKFTLDLVEKSEKFVASPYIIQTANGLGTDRDAIERSAPHMFLPAKTTWIDFSASRPDGGIDGGRHGVLLASADGSLHRGQGMVIVHLRRPPTPQTVWDEQGGYMQVGFTFDLRRNAFWSAVHMHQALFFSAAGGSLDLLSRATWSAIALINTPRIADVRDADLSQVNNARMKRKQPPILQHKIVTIAIDRGTHGDGFQKTETGGRPLHHVRAFLRMRLGKVQLVRPHWRGNPRFGVVVHRYVAMRAEDEAGPWQGGPVPPPSVIKE